MPRSISNSKSKKVPNQVRDDFGDMMQKIIDVGLLPPTTPRWLIDKKIYCSHRPFAHSVDTADLGATYKCPMCNVVWTFTSTPEGNRWIRDIPVRTYIVYSPEFPEHLTKEGYTNIRQSGHYDRKTNTLVGAEDLGPYEVIDNLSERNQRKSKGAL